MEAFHVDSDSIAVKSNDTMESIEDRLSGGEFSSDDNFGEGDSNDEESNDTLSKNAPKKSGMANVISRILSKDTSKSNRLLLAKGKTNREILNDITRRRQKRENDGISKPDAEFEEKDHSTEEQRFKEEKRKLWENMGRKTALEMDVPREAKLRKIATQGMVQLFQSVYDHQKLMNQKIASVGPSERKKDKVIAEFTKGKFLDVLKSKTGSQTNSKHDSTKQDGSGGGKWKILQDDFMMGAQMKDWDKEEDEDDNENNGELMSDNEMSD